MTAPTPATPQEVIADAIVAAFDGPDADDGDVSIVVSAHAIAEVAWKATAQQVADAESLAADTYARLLDMTAERDALRRQVDAAWDGAPGGTAPWGVQD